MCAATDPLLGHTIAERYVLEGPARDERLGRVYHARDLASEGWADVKVLRHALVGDPAALHRFEREVRALAALNHPHVPRVLDHQWHRGLFPYAVLERLDGLSLRELVRLYAPLPVNRVAAIGAQLARVVAACHSRNVVHRGLGPDGVLLLDNAETGDFAVVCDFGEAWVGVDDEIELPRSHGYVGDLACLAPEYLRHGVAGPQSDVYSLGVLLYALRCGVVPFEGRPGEVVDAHVRQRPRPTHDRLGVSPTWMDELIGSTLLKDANARPTAADVVELLQEGAQSDLDAPARLPVGVVKRRDVPTDRGADRRHADPAQAARVTRLGALIVAVAAVALVVMVALRLALLRVALWAP